MSRQFWTGVGIPGARWCIREISWLSSYPSFLPPHHPVFSPGVKPFSQQRAPPDNSLVRRPSHQPGRQHDNLLSQSLLSARTLEETVEVLEQETDKMDIVSLSVALDVLFDTLRNEQLSTKAKHELLTTVGFQKLCKSLRRLGPSLEPADLINGVKLLSILSPPATHHTLQILLKLISKHANSLDLQQLAYLQFLLDKMDPISKSPLSAALEVALPIVFEAQLSSQMDWSDIQAICDYLHYSTKYKLSDKVINSLVEGALRVSDRIPTHLAVTIMWSLCDIKNDSPSHEPLVQWCFRKLTDSIDTLKLKDLCTVVSKCVRKYSKRTGYFYDQDFFEAYCRICLEKGGTEEILWSMKNVSIFKHINIDLVDKVGELISSNPSLMLNNDAIFYILVKGLSNINYKPEKWSSFSSILLEHPALALTKTMGTKEIPLVVDLIALELFPEEIIQRLFSADGLPILEQFQERHGATHLVLLYNAVKQLYPSYQGPLPPKSMIESWKEQCRASNSNKYPLKAALQTGLGGDNYVINGMYHNGLHIDHGIVMRKGGYPVAVNQSDSQSDTLASIPMPPESVIVLVNVFPNDSYTNNTRRLRGPAGLKLRILEKLGHPIIAVDLDKWGELLDHEKIPFLMQKIRGKMEGFQWNQTWGDVVP